MAVERRSSTLQQCSFMFVFGFAICLGSKKCDNRKWPGLALQQIYGGNTSQRQGSRMQKECLDVYLEQNKTCLVKIVKCYQKLQTQISHIYRSTYETKQQGKVGWQRTMRNLYKEIAPELTNREANFEICSEEVYFILFGNDIIWPI